MKNIIKQGRPIVYRRTCPRCGCIFDYDIFEINSVGTVECPDCFLRILHNCDDLVEVDDET